MKRLVKTNILIIFALITTIILSAGASMWLIIHEHTITAPKYTDIRKAPTITYVANNVYEGEITAATIRNNVSVILDGKDIKEEGTISLEQYEVINEQGTYTKTNQLAFGTSESNSKQIKFKITFTPKDSNLYLSTAIEKTVTMYAVAHDDGTNNGMDATEYFGSIEYALNHTKTNKVYVIPGLNKTAGGATVTSNTGYSNLYTPVISSSTGKVEIKSGYSLYLPYSGTTYSNRNGTSYSPYCVSKVLLKNELVVNGTLVVGGVLGCPGQGTSGNTAGVTSGTYAMIEMQENSKITNNGIINCYGYITDPTNKAVINANPNATIYMPFLAYDYHGGSHTAGAYTEGGVSPFYIFDCPNIQAELKCTSGATIITYASLYTNEKMGIIAASYNTTDIKILGRSGALINLKNGEITFKYTPTQGANFGNSVENSKPDVRAETEIIINGDTDSGVLTMQVTALGVIEVSLSDVLFPVSYKFDLKLMGDHDYVFTSSYKFLPGSSLTVGEGATLTINSNAEIIFYNDFCDDAGTDHSAEINPIKARYPEEERLKPAVCEINGNLLVKGSFGGNIISNSIGACVNASSPTSLSVSSDEGNGDWGFLSGSFTKIYTETQSANGLLYTIGGEFPTENKDLSNAVYYSYKNLETNSCYWILESSSFSLNYNHGDVIPTSNDNPTTYKISDYKLLNDPETVGYEFAGWFLTSDYSVEKQIFAYDGAELLKLWNGDATIYAKWKPISYEVTFNENNSDIALGSMDIEANTLFNPYTNEQVSEIVTQFDNVLTYNKYFGGWYTDSEFTNRVSEDGIKIQQDTQLYAKWITKTTISFVTNNTGYTINTIYLKAGDVFNPYQHDSQDKKFSEDLTYQDYFDGWYIDSSLEKIVSEREGYVIDSDENAITMFAKWTQKEITITIQASGDATVTVTSSETITTNKNATYYVKNGTYLTVTLRDSDGFKSVPSVVVGEKNIDWESINADKTTYSTSLLATGNITIIASGNCIAAGTMITLADGTQKAVEDLTTEDILLVFNHETGEYEAAGIIFIENDGYNYYNVINLEFSDGRITRLIYEHALFDITLNKYVYITESNYSEFVGHEFAVESANGFDKVTLEKAYLTNEYTGCYSLVTVYHLNYFIDGLFSIPGGITGLFNFFEYDSETLKYDAEKMQADIEKYGLFTYEDFADYLPKEVYDMFPAEYLKVAIGKEMVTFEEILGYIEQFLVKNGIIE